MTTLDKCCLVSVSPLIGWAVWLAASEPLFGRPYGQPALVASDQAASRLAPTGFDQAQVCWR